MEFSKDCVSPSTLSVTASLHHIAPLPSVDCVPPPSHSACLPASLPPSLAGRETPVVRSMCNTSLRTTLLHSPLLSSFPALPRSLHLTDCTTSGNIFVSIYCKDYCRHAKYNLARSCGFKSKRAAALCGTLFSSSSPAFICSPLSIFYFCYVIPQRLMGGLHLSSCPLNPTSIVAPWAWH